MASSSSSQASSLHHQSLQQDHTAFITTILLISSTTLVFLFFFRCTNRQQQPKKSNKPLPPSDRGWLPFLGVAFSFYADVNKYLTKKHEQYPNQPFRIYFMGRWWTLVYELADVKLILNSKDSELSFLESLNDCMKRMLPKKFTLVPRHGFFLNVFREANMPLIAQWLVEEVPEIVSLMLLPPAPPASASPAPAPAGAIDLFKTCRHIAMRISLRVLFGSQIFVNERYDRYYDSFAPIYPEERLLDGLILLLRDPNRKERAWDTITQITGEMLDHYIKLEKKAEGGECECVMHFLVRQHLEQQQQEQQSGTLTSSSSFSTLDLETVLKDTFTFVWASNTSTYLVLAWCIWEMMGNKGNLQERVLAETSTKIDNNNNKTNPTNLAQVVDEWVVGKAMVDEVIRLQTPGLLLRKVMAPEGVTLSTGHHVPTGEFVGFSYPWLQTLPDFYHNPLEFDIDRYLVRDEKKKAGIYSLQWGGGRHVCMGTKFAMMEIYLVVHQVFSKYTLTKITEVVEVRKEQLGFPAKPANFVYIKVVEKGTGVS